MSLSPIAVKFDEIWNGSLRDDLTSVLSLRPCQGIRVMEDVYRLCTSQPVCHSATLYGALVQLFCDRAVAMHRELGSVHGPDRLPLYVAKWQRWRKGVLYVNALCSYLNAHWVAKRAALAERQKLSGPGPRSGSGSGPRGQDTWTTTTTALPSLAHSVLVVSGRPPAASAPGPNSPPPAPAASGHPTSSSRDKLKKSRKAGKHKRPSTAASAGHESSSLSPPRSVVASSQSHSLSSAGGRGGEQAVVSSEQYAELISKCLAQAPSPVPVDVLAFTAWQHLVWAGHQRTLVDASLDLTQRHRDGQQVNLAPVADLALSFVQLGVPQRSSPKLLYVDYFEGPFIAASGDYWARESASWLAEHGVAAYMARAEFRLSDEHRRAKRLLDPSSLRPLSLVFDQRYIATHIDHILADVPRYLAQHQQEASTASFLEPDLRPDTALGPQQPLLHRESTGGDHVVDRLSNTTSAIRPSDANDGNINDTSNIVGGGGGGGAVHLGRAYLLVSRVPDKLGRLAELVGGHIEASLRAAVFGTLPLSAANDDARSPGHGKVAAAERGANPQQFMTALLAVYRRSFTLVTQAFSGSLLFTGAMDKAFRAVLNDSLAKQLARGGTAELLAKYCSLLLHKVGQQRLAIGSDADHLDRCLDEAIAVFRYLEEKDVFQKFYAAGLARRLIDQASVSDDAERHMLTGLKQACGFNYVSKLQRMFTDIATSAETNEAFGRFCSGASASPQLPCDCSVLVLTSSAWPISSGFGPGSRGQSGSCQRPSSLSSSSSSIPFVVPKPLLECRTVFERFYMQQHSGRKLSWLHHTSWCKAEVRTVNWTRRKYEFVVTDQQLAVLLQFNDTDSVPLAGNPCGLSENDIRTLVQSLIDARAVRMDGEQMQQLQLNPDFVSKRLRVNFTARLAGNRSSAASAAAAATATLAAVDKDRRMLLQAAIVRVAKARRRLTHQMLVAQVIQQMQSRFQPSVASVKKEIDHLIQSEYLRRAGDEGELKNVYEYLA